MHWSVVAPFLQSTDESGWITPYVPGNRHKFAIVPRLGTNVNWHDRSSPVTSYDEWRDYWQQSETAWKTTKGGIITVFPQLAATVGVRRILSTQHVPIVAWWFNTNGYPGLRKWLAQISLKSIDRFIVHNRCEQKFYSKWLDIPLERFEFVPLQVGDIPITYTEETEKPFILSTGSAYRDFPLLFQAVQKLGLRTIVVSGQRALQGLDIPPLVETPFGLKKSEIIRLVQQARINVIPMTTEGITAGTVTIAEAMRMGRAIIATRRSGVEDYIQHGETGLLVEPYSLNDLVHAIDKLWHNKELRNRLAKAAGNFGAMHLSDQAAGKSLGQILDNVADCLGQY